MSGSLTRRKFHFLIIGLTLCLATGILILGLPWAIQAITIFQLEKMTGHTVNLENVSVDYIDRRVTLAGFELKEPDSNESLVTIERVQVEFRLWPVLKKHIKLTRVVLDRPVVSVVRESDGTLNFSRLRQREQESAEPSEFVTIVQDFMLNNGTLLYQDFTNPAHPEVRADGISLEVSNFSTQGTEPIPVILQATLAEKGLIIAKGQMHVEPFSIKSTWDIQNVHLSPYQDFMSELPPISGKVNSSFNLKIPTDGFSQVSLTGNFVLNDLRVGARPSPFLTGQEISVSDVSFSGRNNLAIAKVIMRNLSLEIIRDEHGTLPVLAHFQAKRPQKSPSEERKPGMTPDIGEIQLENGNIRFIDQTVQPEYRKEFTQVMVNMNNLNANSGQMGHVKVEASTLDEESIAMEGDIKIFGGEFYLDADGEVKKISISSFNPYSEKLLGWGTQSGQLTTDIHVHIEEQHLESKSKIGISDLRVVRAGTDDLVNKTVGLPLGLVVDLIKNINGDIKLKIEVDGPLNKPEFSIRDAIWKSIRNAVVNIVTAPLKLIGRLVKGDNKIQTIDIAPIHFKAGTKALAEGMEKRLTDLQQFLKKTPYIHLKIQPVINAQDSHMLRIMAVTSRIAELESEKSLSKGVEAAQMLYREKFLDKTPPDQEVALLEELVAIEPDPTDQTSVLASERAKMVVDRLTVSQNISETRLHVAEYKQISDERDARGIEFSITR